MDIAWEQDKELQFEEPRDNASAGEWDARQEAKSLQTNPIPLFLVFSYILWEAFSACKKLSPWELHVLRSVDHRQKESRCQAALTDLANFLWRGDVSIGLSFQIGTVLWIFNIHDWITICHRILTHMVCPPDRQKSNFWGRMMMFCRDEPRHHGGREISMMECGASRND